MSSINMLYVSRKNDTENSSESVFEIIQEPISAIVEPNNCGVYISCGVLRFK